MAAAINGAVAKESMADWDHEIFGLNVTTTTLRDQQASAESLQRAKIPFNLPSENVTTKITLRGFLPNHDVFLTTSIAPYHASPLRQTLVPQQSTWCSVM